MGLRIYFTSVITENDAKLMSEIQQLETLMQHLNLSKDNETLLAAIQHLTNLNDKLSSDNEKLRRDYNNLTVQLGDLTQNYTVLESKITNLTTDVQNLTTGNLQLETQRKNLTKRIQDMEKNWNELNVSRAQWSIDAYCPKTSNVRQCNACLKGWLTTNSQATNCYAYNNPFPPDQKTWEEARENCRGKRSDLVVVNSQEEQV
ncbi:C-type lectin domain family 10 member A-like [Perca flavescens]|uniref:C-type lectin domain family 10 member A-like n=1 Tax=Perca flavescens TaxID=8167 RepID=UPI00106E0597|nr:C-type lectin domain family 10 member A-like [Perca flavescens]